MLKTLPERWRLRGKILAILPGKIPPWLEKCQWVWVIIVLYTIWYYWVVSVTRIYSNIQIKGRGYYIFKYEYSIFFFRVYSILIFGQVSRNKYRCCINCPRDHIVQGDRCLRDFCPMIQLSKDTLVLGVRLTKWKLLILFFFTIQHP